MPRKASKRSCSHFVYGASSAIRRSVTVPVSPAGASHRAYRKIAHSADQASFEEIFLPSAYVRPWYEIGTS